eukprot:6371474-Amphidinium_carterae.2
MPVHWINSLGSAGTKLLRCMVRPVSAIGHAKKLDGCILKGKGPLALLSKIGIKSTREGNLHMGLIRVPSGVHHNDLAWRKEFPHTGRDARALPYGLYEEHPSRGAELELLRAFSDALRILCKTEDPKILGVDWVFKLRLLGVSLISQEKELGELFKGGRDFPFWTRSQFKGQPAEVTCDPEVLTERSKITQYTFQTVVHLSSISSIESGLQNGKTTSPCLRS